MRYPRDTMRLLVLFILIHFGSSLSAQKTIQPKNSDYLNKGILYNTEWAIEPRWNTDGYGIALLVGTIKKYNKTNFKKIEIGNLKHPRENRQAGRQVSTGERAGSYIYGKVNHFFPLRATIGTKRYFSEKSKRKGIAVGLSYEVGPSLGLLKPYILRIARLDAMGENIIVSEERYSEDNAADFLDVEKILGSAGLLKGFDGFTIKPGISAKVGSHFAWGAYDKNVLALEVGLMIDVYFGDIELVATDDNQPYYLGFYVSAQFGKRK